MKNSVYYNPANPVSGIIDAPPSKSAAQRVAAISLLKSGKTVVRNMYGAADVDASLSIIKDLGADVCAIDGEKKDFEITGGLKYKSPVIDCQESGLSFRMFSPIAAKLAQCVKMIGSGSLIRRPVGMIEPPLISLGVKCNTNKNYLPVDICGPVTQSEVHIDGSISSQFLTGLLISQGENADGFRVTVDNLKSKPYIDLTIQIMRDFNVQVDNKDYLEFYIPPGQKYQLDDYSIEGDWSGASFFIVLGVTSGNIFINNLRPDSLQADRKIYDLLNSMNAEISFTESALHVKKSVLSPFNFDATQCPDLFPPLVSLAASIRGVSTIKGVTRLRFKESDRATVLKEEFSNLGINIVIEKDTMIVHGGTLKSGAINSNMDHRIAMAGAICAAGGKKIIIENSEAVEKSYKAFYSDLTKTGGIIE